MENKRICAILTINLIKNTPANFDVLLAERTCKVKREYKTMLWHRIAKIPKKNINITLMNKTFFLLEFQRICGQSMKELKIFRGLYFLNKFLSPCFTQAKTKN